jgi:hypothetical protein
MERAATPMWMLRTVEVESPEGTVQVVVSKLPELT